MEVILFSTHCPRCEILAKKLNDNNIKFSENNDIDAMLAMGLTTAPALKVDDKIMGYLDAIKWLNKMKG